MRPRSSCCLNLAVLSVPASIVFHAARAVAGDFYAAGIDGAPCSYLNIAEAISDAPDGATVFVRPGTYFQKLGEISGKKLQILPSDPEFPPCTEALEPAPPDTVILDGAGGSDDTIGGLVEVTGGAVVEFRNMTLRNATAAKGGILAVTGDESAVVMHNAMLFYGKASDLGGAAYVGPNGFLRLEAGARVEASEADQGSGGGIALEGATLEITDGSIGEQSVTPNGDIGVLPAPNFASVNGGGIHAVDSEIVLGAGARILANVAGLAGGGIHATSSTVTGTGAVIDANSAGTSGGGIFVAGEGASLEMEEGSVSGNRATASIGFQGGGGIFAEGPVTVSLEAVQIVGNSSAFLGGGIVGANGAELDLYSCAVDDSEASGPGGGIFVTSEATSLAVVNSVVRRNTSGLLAGGIYSQFASVKVQDSDVSSNEAPEGAGLHLEDTGLYVSLSYVAKNSSIGDGGGVWMKGGSAEIVDGYFTGNEAGGDGGGVWADGTSISATRLFVEVNDAATRGAGLSLVGEGASLAVDDGTIYANRLNSPAADGGAGLYASGDVEVLLEKLAVTENESPHVGGGIAAAGGAQVTLASDSLVEGNTADLFGGGVYAELEGTQVIVTNSTLRSNVAGKSGGGLYSTLANVTIAGSVVEGNEANTGGGLGLRLSEATLTNAIVRGNHSTSAAGGILIEGSQVAMGSDFSSCDPASLPADTYCSEVRGNQAESFAGGIGQFGSPSGEIDSFLAVDGVLFQENTCSGGGTALFVSEPMEEEEVSPASTDLRNVLVRANNSGSSVAIYFGGEGHLTLDSSTLVENAGRPLSVIDEASSVEVRNSLFFDNAKGPFVGVGVTFVRSCNGSQQEDDGSLDFFASNLNPKFTTTARGAFRLDADSPFVDFCEDGAAHDLDGVVRPRLTAWDAGAFEYALPTSTTTTLPVSDCGDVNADGDVTAADALAALRAAVGTIACAACVCDADGSGGVFAADALRLLQYAVGLDVQLQCESCT